MQDPIGNKETKSVFDDETLAPIMPELINQTGLTSGFLADLALNPDSPLKMYEAALRDDSFNVFYNAPCLVYIIGFPEVRSIEVDCALTAAYLMFSAASRGLGTCWIGLGAHIRGHEILREICIPETCRIVAPIILGYPTAVPPASERHAPDIVRVI